MAIRKRLGALLVENRLISKEQLDNALAIQAHTARPLGAILTEGGLISESLLLQALARQRGVPAWDLSRDNAAEEATRLIKGAVCRQYQILPVQLRGDLLTLAMRNPADIDAIDLVRNVTKMRVEPALADETRLAAAIEEAYKGDLATPGSGSVDALVGLAMTAFDNDIRTGRGPKEEEITEADSRPVVELVNQMILDAIRARASDIHIESRSGRIDLRYRVDGELVKIREFPAQLLPMIAVRIKIMASMDIVEFRIPQDGRIGVHVDGRNVDLRVSVLPNYHGPRIVMRILDKTVALKRLDDLGFESNNLSLFRSLIEKPYGMFLVTGPTGSGKTTTLYAALNELKRVSNNIMTCEDPVEYDIDGINQSQVHEKVGLTFASQLRAILRQDPDIILVGEIRDQETAETAIRAALTGHLVLSTLHCNDAPSAVPRLLDMGIDPYLLSTSLIGVMGQRLLRVLCPHCKSQGEPDAQDLAVMQAFGTEEGSIWKATGCDECHGTGYMGRMGVHEVMPVTLEAGKLIANIAPIETIRSSLVDYGYRTMQEDALERVQSGNTTYAEARRLIFFDTLRPKTPEITALQLAS